VPTTNDHFPLRGSWTDLDTEGGKPMKIAKVAHVFSSVRVAKNA
jgi:hypothetical protein